MTGQLLGLARVSTKQQSVDAQVDALMAVGVDRERIYIEHGVSGANTRSARPGLTALLDYARPGDTLVVTALDRAARSLSESVRLVDELRVRGIHLRSLREGFDLGTPSGRFIAAIFQALAELERALIAERAASAREAAAARGKHTGRPPKLNDEQKAMARTLHEAGVDYGAIARQLNCSRATIYRAVESAP